MYGYQKNRFEQTCQKCGALFEVRVSNTPDVRLVSPRTDG